MNVINSYRSASPLPPEVYTGMVRHIAFEDLNSTVIEHFGNNGTYVGSPTQNQTGQVNKAVSFDGFNDYAGMDNLGITGFPFTFMGWIYKADFEDGNTCFLVYSDHATLRKGFNVQVSGIGEVQLVFGDGLGSAPTNRKTHTSLGTTTTSGWNHVIVKATDIDTVTMKINNVAQTLAAASGSATTVDFSTDYNFMLNARGSSYSEGIPDEFTVYNGITTDAVDTLVYNRELSGQSIF